MKETEMINLFKKTYPYFKKYLWIHIVCYALGIFIMLILALEPQILALIVDRVINPACGEAPVKNSSLMSFVLDGVPADDLWATLMRLVTVQMIIIGMFFATFFTKWHLAHYFGLKSEKVLRRTALDKLNTSSNSVLNKYSSGDLLTITNSDPAKLKVFYSDFIPRLIEPIFYNLIAAYYLYKLNLWLMIFPMVTGVCFIFITKRYMRKSKYYFDKRWKVGSNLNTEIQESIYGIRTIKSYAREDYQKEIFDKKNNEYKNTMFEFGDFRARFTVLYSSIQNGFYILSIISGIIISVNMQMTDGEFTSFLTYMLSIAGQFIGISNALGDIQECVVSSDRMFRFFEEKDPEKDSYADKMITDKPSIVLNNLSVIPNEEDTKDSILKNITLEIPYGKKIGIMGETGSGKSVLLKTLQTFFEPTEGEYLINGIDSHEYKRESIRRNFSYAMQDIFLFSNTIEANIAYFKPDAPEADVRKCGQMAEVDEFALKMKDGYGTIVGEKGFGLSGGQKQRVSIARALLKDASILVFDDSTSALDFDTEKKVFANIKKMCSEKTLLIATHRASALKDMDEILYMENGEIVERGTHSELLKLDGKYATIYKHQSSEEVAMNE